MRSLLVPLLLASTTQAAEPCLIIEQAQNGWKSLTSPDYPKQFNPNTQCIYRISAPKGERIEIEFVDFLFITHDNAECQRQSLSIRDPEVEDIIGKYCGNTKPPNYSSMGDQLFMLLNSESVGEYKGFHIKYRIYGSSAEPAAKVAAKSTPKKKPVKKQAKPVVRNNSGRTQLSIKKMPQVAMKSAPIAKQPGVELGGIEKHIGLNIEMQIPKIRHRRQYGNRAGVNWDYGAQSYGTNNMVGMAGGRGGAGMGGARGGAGAGAAGPMSRRDRFQAAAEATVTSRETPAKKSGCRPGYPCAEDPADEYVAPQRTKAVLCIGCKESKERSKNYLSYFIWFVVLAIFGGIGWYVYQTYFGADDEAKKKAEEAEKAKEAEGNLGAATLARGGAKFSDAPPRYESWQDHAQPLSTTGAPPRS